MDHTDGANLPQARRRARAAQSNRPGRFEAHERFTVEDGWAPDPDLPLLRTEVTEECPKRIVTRNSSPDLHFDRSVNPYRGCEHGCIYCFARPTHAYLGLSAGLDFETRLTAKPDAPALLRKEISRPRYSPAPIAFGTNTDPYQPIERDRRIMRGCLEVLQAFRHPLSVVTKGTLVERDADVLGEMGQAGLAHVALSVTTLDAALARAMEPRVPSPAQRLRSIERLPLEVSPLFQEWLAQARPDRAARVMARIRDTHGGAEYDAAWHTRMTGQGPYARMIQQRYRLSLKRLGLAARPPELRTDLFAVPPQAGDQLSLF